MTHTTRAQIKRNYENMRVGLTIQPFGDEVVKGWFLHRKHIDSVYQTVQPTVEFVYLCIGLFV